MNIYVDGISDEMIQEIKTTLGLTVNKRPDEWNVNELMKYITDPNLKLIVINKIDSQSIAEITLAHLFCKEVLVTCSNITEYPHIYDMVSEVQPQCNLEIDNNSFINWFINWYKYTRK